MPRKSILAEQLNIRRGLDENAAATYLSLSPSKFRQMVDLGQMPRPRLAGRRRIWDVRELDAAFDQLPREGGETDGSSWADYA